ncbi:hypothetical protein SPLC1_S080520 [Arthrospira platensis C1]|nr:hypothetical protein SPLC1_S080520 [Arthrospira platensis C1]
MTAEPAPTIVNYPLTVIFSGISCYADTKQLSSESSPFSGFDRSSNFGFVDQRFN